MAKKTKTKKDKKDETAQTPEEPKPADVVLLSEDTANIVVNLIYQHVPLPRAQTDPVLNAITGAPRVKREHIEELQAIIDAKKKLKKGRANLKAVKAVKGGEGKKKTTKRTKKGSSRARSNAAST